MNPASLLTVSSWGSGPDRCIPVSLQRLIHNLAPWNVMEILALLLKIKSRSSRIGPGKNLPRSRVGAYVGKAAPGALWPYQGPTLSLEGSEDHHASLHGGPLGGLNFSSHAGPKHLPR